jgi:urease subunit alpha
MSRQIGSIAVGKRGLVLRSPAFFGAKPEMEQVFGTIACALMGDTSASIPTLQLVDSRPMHGAFGRTVQRGFGLFVPDAVKSGNFRAELGLQEETLAVENTRSTGKADMKLNDAMPMIEVHPETYEVRANGER